MLTIAHIVNPIVVPPSSDLYVAQPITFETMRLAREFAANTLKVHLHSAQYAEDRLAVPHFLKMTPDLERSIIDIAPVVGKRRLPLIKDILDRLYESSNADYFVYTNVDIGLKQDFYLAIGGIIGDGYDAFSITRRTVSSRFQRIEDIPQIYLDKGTAHPGWDCFVFARRLYRRFRLENVCLGVPPVGRVLLCNCIRSAKQFKIFKDEHLTFHIGDEGTWKGRSDGAYLANLKCGLGIVQGLYASATDSRSKALLMVHLDRLRQQLDKPYLLVKPERYPSLQKARRLKRRVRRAISRGLLPLRAPPK
jgi:hypothetical protein